MPLHTNFNLTRFNSSNTYPRSKNKVLEKEKEVIIRIEINTKLRTLNIPWEFFPIILLVLNNIKGKNYLVNYI